MSRAAWGPCCLDAHALGWDDAAGQRCVETSLDILATFRREPVDTDRRDANRADFRELVSHVLRRLPRACCRSAYAAGIREGLRATPLAVRPYIAADLTA